MPIAHTLQEHPPGYEHAASSRNGQRPPSARPTGATPAIRRSPCCAWLSPSRRSPSASTSSSTCMVHWPNYLAPWINDIAPGTGQQFMYFVGGTEILAGLIVALKPRYGAYVVAAWLGGIIINLLTYSGFYDIALRDFGLMLAALTLGRLASVYDAPLRLRATEATRRPSRCRQRHLLVPLSFARNAKQRTLRSSRESCLDRSATRSGGLPREAATALVGARQEAAAPTRMKNKSVRLQDLLYAPERIRTSTIHKDHKALNLVTHGRELTYVSICRDVSAADDTWTQMARRLLSRLLSRRIIPRQIERRVGLQAARCKPH